MKPVQYAISFLISVIGFIAGYMVGKAECP